MTEPAYSHIQRFIRVQFERGRISAAAAVGGLRNLGLPDDTTLATQMRIECLWHDSDHREAMNCAGKAVARWPKRLWFRLAHARSARLCGEIDMSNQAATELMRRGPLVAPVSAGLAEILVLLGRYIEATAILKIARTGGEGDAPLSNRTTKQNRAALTHLLSIIARERCWHHLMPLLAVVHHDAILPAGQFKFHVKTLVESAGSAAGEFLSAIWPAIDSPDGAAAALAGAVCQRLELRPQAEHYTEVARMALGNNLPAMSRYAWCSTRLAQKELESLTEQTTIWLVADPGNLPLAAYQAEALFQGGDPGKAIETLRAVPTSTPGNTARIARLIARLFIRNGEPQRAISTLQSVTSLPDEPAAALDHAFINSDALVALGRIEDAMAELKACQDLADASLADAPLRERFIDHMTRLLALDGRIEHAMALLPRATRNIDLLRKAIIGSIVTADLRVLLRAEEALTRALLARWRPGQSSPGYNQHLLFARNTRLNAAFKDLCETIGNKDDADALPALRDYLQAQPFDYSAAIQFIFRMSRLGKLSSPAADGTISIPKRIVFFWDEPSPPPAVDHLIETWRSAHPAFDIAVFDTESARAYLKETMGERHARAFGRAQNAAMKADFFRLCYVYHSGGIYTDCDDRCRHPVDDWLVGRDAVLYQESHMSFAVANNFIAAVPGQPYLAAAIEQALISLEAPVRSFTFSVTGPGLLTMCFGQWLLQADDNALSRTRLLKAGEYFQNISPHLHLPHKGTARHWVKQEGAGA